ncbi:hypothetical protein DFJ58DRAFT_734303 [Suillus subalutaceus]|uniref:uncharacterized protein n=1 Tax=Suillus subalutaceus TaxID=48586 RepID=UPI001B881BCE|nr:uncharacterized protein DFJ58DRAFT_734303 [Suillus subalutaceus]KAG1837584.1 hypothetical protein DFJ58DRAFT_734303 [Suillus subalutaceus]
MLRLITDYTEPCPSVPDFTLDPEVTNHLQSDTGLLKGMMHYHQHCMMPAAWDILTQFLTSSMSMSEMDDMLVSYLGDRYHEDDWVEPRRLLFSGDGNDAESLRNLKLSQEDCSVGTSASRTNGSLSSSPVRKLLMRPKATNSTSKIGEEEMESGWTLTHLKITKNSFILDMAKVGDDDEEEEGGRRGEGYGDGTSVGSAMVTRLARPLATQNAARHKAARMPLTEFPKPGCIWFTFKELPLNMSPHTFERKDSRDRISLGSWPAYTLVTEEERGAVERSQSEFPNPAWVRVKNGPYRGDTALVFEQLPNGIVAILIVSRDMPYAMPGRTRALVEQSRLPKNKTVSDVIHDDQVVGWKFKGESYYWGSF